MALSAEQLSYRAALKEQAAQATHKRRLAANRSRAAANKSVIAARQQASATATAQRQQAQEAAIAARTAGVAQQQQTRIAAAQTQRKQVRTERVQGQVASSAVSTFTPSSDSNIVMTTLFLMAGLVVVYRLVTNSGQFSSYTGKMGDLLHKVSSTAPLFQVKSTS